MNLINVIYVRSPKKGTGSLCKYWRLQSKRKLISDHNKFINSIIMALVLSVFDSLHFSKSYWGPCNYISITVGVMHMHVYNFIWDPTDVPCASQLDVDVKSIGLQKTLELKYLNYNYNDNNNDNDMQRQRQRQRQFIAATITTTTAAKII